MHKELRNAIIRFFVLLTFVSFLLNSCDLPNAHTSDRQKTMGKWVYSSFVFNNGTVQSFDGNIMTTTSNGVLQTIDTNPSYSALVFNENNMVFWKTYYTNGDIDTNMGSWSIKEADNLLTLTKVYYTNIILPFTNIYFVYNYAYTYDFIDDNTLKITAEKDSFNCIKINNQPTNFSVNNLDVFAVAGMNYAELVKK